jgi:hypothetical protein
VVVPLIRPFVVMVLPSMLTLSYRMDTTIYTSNHGMHIHPLATVKSNSLRL